MAAGGGPGNTPGDRPPMRRPPRHGYGLVLLLIVLTYVLALMADGLSNTDIAERLQISEKTVRNHASNLFDKLGVWSRAQAIVFARDHGFSG